MRADWDELYHSHVCITYSSQSTSAALGARTSSASSGPLACWPACSLALELCSCAEWQKEVLIVRFAALRQLTSRWLPRPALAEVCNAVLILPCCVENDT